MTDERSAERRLLKPVAVFSALSVIRQGMSLLLLPIYVKYIDAAEYGVLAAITIAASIMAMVSNLKLDAAVRTFVFDHASDESRMRDYVRQIVTVATVCAGVLYAVVYLFGETAFLLLFSSDDIRFGPQGAIALATACLLACFSPYLAYLRTRHALRELIVWELLLVVGTVVLQLIFVVGMGLGLTGVLWGALIPVAVTGAFIFLTNPWLIAVRIEWSTLQPSLRYALPLVGLGLIYVFGGKLDGLFLVRYVSIDQFGAYALAIGIFGLLRIALNVLDDAFRPFLFPALRSSDSAALRVVDSCHKLYLLVGLVALSAAVALSSSLHLLTNDPRYLAMQAWIPWVASAYVPRVIVRFHALVLEAQKRSVDMTAGIVVRFLVRAVALLWLVPAQGVKGALWAAIIAESVNALIFVLVTRHKESLRSFWRRAGIQIVVFLTVIWIVSATVSDWSVTLSGAMQCAAIALALLWLNGFRNVHALRVVIAELAAGERARVP